MAIVEVGIDILLICCVCFISMCCFAAVLSSGREKLAKDAYDLGYERGRQAERVNVEEIIRTFAECNEDCKSTFQNCNVCIWNRIIKKIKGDAEC